jgi:hypothetical protein
MRNVVAVAHIGEFHVVQVAELLLQREIVCERLAGMLEFTQSVDHRDAGVFRHSCDRCVRERTQHDAINPALEIMRDVAEALSRVDARRGLIDKECVSTEAGDTGLEGEARAQRWLLEEHHQLLAGERAAKVGRTSLHQAGETVARVI